MTFGTTINKKEDVRTYLKGILVQLIRITQYLLEPTGVDLEP